MNTGQNQSDSELRKAMVGKNSSRINKKEYWLLPGAGGWGVRVITHLVPSGFTGI